jgi:hypothetical protein
VCGGKLFEMTSPILSKELEVESPRSLPPLYCPATINKSSQRFSVLCTPLFNESRPTLDVLYAKTEPLIRRARSLLESEATVDQLLYLKLEAEQLKEEYDAWPETVPQEWKPRSVGVFLSKNSQVP